MTKQVQKGMQGKASLGMRMVLPSQYQQAKLKLGQLLYNQRNVCASLA